jgi:hypothetical protein
VVVGFQVAARHEQGGDAVTDLGLVNPAIYRIARNSSCHKAFHDVTAGNNNVTIGSVTVTGPLPAGTR